MSTWGRAQDALHGLWLIPGGYESDKPGIVQELGITYEQWSALTEPILEAVGHIFSESGAEGERRRWEPVKACRWPRE